MLGLFHNPVSFQMLLTVIPMLVNDSHSQCNRSISLQLCCATCMQWICRVYLYRQIPNHSLYIEIGWSKPFSTIAGLVWSPLLRNWVTWRYKLEMQAPSETDWNKKNSLILIWNCKIFFITIIISLISIIS